MRWQLLQIYKRMQRSQSHNLIRIQDHSPLKIQYKASYQHSSTEQRILENAQIIQKDLHRTLAKCLKIPIQIETFCWLYGLFAVCSAMQILVRVPFDLLLSMFNVFLPLLGRKRYKHTALFACLIILGYYIVTQELNFLDVSVLYHSFRGQSYVKLYGAGLALQISQKLLTMAGCFLFDKLNQILIQQRPSSFSLGFQMLICLMYCLLHFFSLYLDFILYIIILNSSSQNVMMFYFVVNLAKMKLSTFKKFQKKSFRNTIVYDAKDRLHKITYSCLFLLTIAQLRNVQTLIRIASVSFFCATIDYLRHLTNLTMAGQLSYMQKMQHSVCHELYWGQKCLALKEEKKGQLKGKTERAICEPDKSKTVKIEDYIVVKCAKWDFTIIPYLLLVLKFFSIILRTNNVSLNANQLVLQIYVVLCFLAFVIAPLIKNIVRKTNPKHQIDDTFGEAVF